MNPLRLVVAVAVAALALCAFTDEGKHFAIDFPKGWSAPVADGGSFQSNAPDARGGAYCRANSTPLEALKNKTQASLNAEYRAPLDRATWAAVLSIDAEKFQLSESVAQLVGGRIVQKATFVVQADVLGTPMKVRFASYILPGRMVNAGCFASPESFDGMRKVFDGILTSLRPL